MAADLNRTQEWVSAGLISEEQANSIDAFESAQPKTRSAVLEVLGYVGAVLVLIAGLIIVGDMWPDLDRLAKLAIAAIAAGVLVAGGLAATGSEGDSLRRVGQVSLLLAAGPLGLAIGVLAEDNVADEVAVLLGFAAAFVYSTAMYFRDRSWAQHIGMFITGVGTSTLAVIAVNEDWTWQAGAAAFVYGVVWLGLSTTNRLQPRLLGEIAGLSAMMFGSITLIAALEFDEDAARHAVLAVFIAIAFALVAVGTIRDRVAIIVGGMVGLVVYIPWLISSAFGETLGAPVVLLIVGALLIASAVYLTRRMRD
ncbi:MAG: DUF2157 domain-containing protein [Acidimicrobiia bacterium]